MMTYVYKRHESKCLVTVRPVACASSSVQASDRRRPCSSQIHLSRSRQCIHRRIVAAGRRSITRSDEMSNASTLMQKGEETRRERAILN